MHPDFWMRDMERRLIWPDPAFLRDCNGIWQVGQLSPGLALRAKGFLQKGQTRVAGRVFSLPVDGTTLRGNYESDEDPGRR